MKYELIITEKPKAALKIAESLANGKAIKESYQGVPYYKITRNKKDIIVCSAVGHLYTVAEKAGKKWTYPVFDVEWKESGDVNKASEFTKKYVATLKKLCKDAQDITIATDYDIEGEVIGLNVMRFACGRKDANRMKFSTLTKQDLEKAYDKKSPTIDWGLARAGETRHILDWYYGINLSRALTSAIKQAGTFKVLSSGRVQGPALKLLVDKEKEIKAFISVPYWQIQLLGDIKEGSIEAWHSEEKFFDEQKAKTSYNNALGKPAIVESVETTQFKQAPPHPFDLTSLQTEAYRVHKISPKNTLAIAQTLYINGYISYPRTSSQKLPKEIEYAKIMQDLGKQEQYKELSQDLLKKKELVPNEGKKSDPAHPAIYPTGIVPQNVDDYEGRLYDLIVRRFLATFGEEATRETVKVTIDVNKELFIASGTTTVKKGWHEQYGKYATFKEIELPKIEKGDSLKVTELNFLQKDTQPPKRYTPASIIKELEKRNLGTKSTRATIVDTLYNRGYVKSESIEATDLGIQTCGTLEKYCPDILDEELTRHFENELIEIQEKNKEPKSVLDEAKGILTHILEHFKSKETAVGAELKVAQTETRRLDRIVGKCPVCSEGDIRILTSKTTKKRFLACNKYPDCKTTFSLRQTGTVKATKKPCDKCNFPIVSIITKGKRPWMLCINSKCPGKEQKQDVAI